MIAALSLATLGAITLLTTWRPFLGCLAFVTLAPLTVGLTRGVGVPVLRMSEALALAVAAGVAAHRLLHPREQPTSMLDVTTVAFVGGMVLVPVFVLWDRSDIATAFRALLAPVQYLVVYFVFSRAALARDEVRLVLIAVLTVSCAIALVGALQLLDAPGVRGWIAAWYPPSAPEYCDRGQCRPTSLLQHWSAFGAYSLMQYTLALALMATPAVGVSRVLLLVAATANAVGVVASETQAVLLMLPIATVLVAWHRRNVPRDLRWLATLGGVGAALLWPLVSPRLLSQLFYADAISTPESLLTRSRFWTELFVPNALEHLWWGTGTVVPVDVPTRFVHFVDNEYLSLIFRAGVAGVVLFAVAFGALAVAGLRLRRSRSVEGALGASLLASVVSLVLMGVTAEYSTFGGVSQSLWMTAGLLSSAFVVALVPHADEVTPQITRQAVEVVR